MPVLAQTITTQLIAFKLTDYSLIVIGLGFVFLFCEIEKYKKVLAS